ncbi:MAG: 23S rRNA (adenine(2503)-C(2))-methyltransferase RlmN [Thermodesulfobacteriota bacterium]
MQNIYELSLAELEAELGRLGARPFRSRQVWQWVWQKGSTSFGEMTNIGKEFRELLSGSFSLERPETVTVKSSLDTTTKFLLQLADKNLIETVLIPERDHYTLCISSQVGCPLGCTFCSTAKMGFIRNLSSGEILTQILIARDYLWEQGTDYPLRNIVFMGMGEPLLNWENVKRALEVIRDEKGLNFSYRRVTLSSVGIPDRLQEYAQTGLGSLAISLHAPDQELREELMPRAARMFPLQDLIKTLQSLPLRSRQRITIEYILMKDTNENLHHAKKLNKILSSVPCKVNLISYNPDPELPYAAPSPQDVLNFERYLWDKNRAVFLRKSKGQDIKAACGQLQNEYIQK